MTSVSILGLGAMGSRIAGRLAAAGHKVTVWNRTPAAAEEVAASAPVTVADTPRQAVATAQVAISMVTDDAASRSLWLAPDTGILQAMQAGAVAIESSTITPHMARDLAAAAVQAEVALLEAPVVGSRPQADAGALFVLVGGDIDTVERVRPVIDAYAGAIRPVGPIGNAATMKLAINGLFGIQVAAYAEIVGMLHHSTVDTDLAIEILQGLPITSPGLQRILGLFANHKFSPNFPIRLVAKDFNYLTTLATHIGAAAPLTDATSAVFKTAADGEHADLDIAGIATQYVD